VNGQIRKLRRELEAAHEKVNTLTTQLNTNVSSSLRLCLYSHCPHHCYVTGGSVCSGYGVRLVIKRSRVRLPAVPLPGKLGQLSLPSLRLGKSSTSLLAGVKVGRVHLRRVVGNTVTYHVTLCDPIWQVTPRISRTGIFTRSLLGFSL